ncbi:MAG: ABC transporter permease [Chloroflexi bacterium]|nr:ABC transporter permease [Chloroflexota bacterium]
MNKMWTVFKHEYTRHVLRKRFLFALLSVPAWIAVMFLVIFISVLLQFDNTPAGFVDYAGVIVERSIPLLGDEEAEDDLFPDREFLPFSDEESARAALEREEINAYFVLPADYRETLNARLVYNGDEPPSSLRSQFSRLLRYNLLRGQDETVVERVMSGPELVIESTGEGRQMADGEWINIAAPIAAGIFLIVSVFTSSGYLMQAVVEEKENRTMEILATSLSPMQIMSGKVLALISVGLTQAFVWGIVPVIGIVLAGSAGLFPDGMVVNWGRIALVLITGLPTFVIMAAVMATIGATITESNEGQQVSGLVSMIVMSPFMLISLIMFNPNGALATFMSFFPLTACLTLLLRLAFGTVPGWQVYISTAILIFSSVGSLWLAGKVFRMGMLNYGKAMGWKDIASAAFSRREAEVRTSPHKETAS